MLTTIITAGGIGKRLGSEIPKQFLLLDDKAILQYTIEAFYQFDPNSQLIITLPDQWIEYWKNYCIQHKFKIAHEIVVGGEERFHSIREALTLAKGTYIAVHDGVRPLIDPETIKRTLDAAKHSQAAIPVVKVKESLRQYTLNGSQAVKRSEFVMVQTPQIFEANLLKRAYELPFHERITDDASLVESLGIEITLVDGNEKNIKITSPEDLVLAEQFIQIKKG